MRQALAALTDSVVVALLAFLAFHLAGSAIACSSGSCPALMPVVLVLIIGLVGAYFAAGYALWSSTPGRALWFPEDRQ
jgi:hypothetical protein